MLPPPIPCACRRRSLVAATGDGGVGAGRIQRRRPRGRPDPGGMGLGLDGSVHGEYQGQGRFGEYNLPMTEGFCCSATAAAGYCFFQPDVLCI